MSESILKGGFPVLQEAMWLSQVCRMPCDNFKHQVFSEWVEAHYDAPYPLVTCTIPENSCWIITAASVRSVPNLSAPLDISDFRSDESLNPFQELTAGIVGDPIGKLWWVQNGQNQTPESAPFIGISGGAVLFAFAGPSEVILMAETIYTAGAQELYFLVRLNTFMAPVEAQQSLSTIQTQIITGSV